METQKHRNTETSLSVFLCLKKIDWPSFSLGMFIPFANSSGALSGGIVSVIFMLWVSIGGNFSRLSCQTVYETKSLSIDACPSAWNITEEMPGCEPMSGLDWWYHLPIYDLSYMWYSGVACMIGNPLIHV